MIELTPAAQSRLDDYFQELRRVLSQSPSVDAADVERDIRDHIDAALVGHSATVEASALDEVLRKLGSPAQWLPDGEPARFRKSPAELLSPFNEAILEVGRRLAGGPERYRLAYLSLFLFAAALWIFPSADIHRGLGILPLVFMFISFIFARASLALFGAARLTGGQKWLLYPSLVAIYLPVAALLLIAPVTIAGSAAFKSVSEFNQRQRQQWNYDVVSAHRRTKKDLNDLPPEKTLGKASSRSVDENKNDRAVRPSPRIADWEKLERNPAGPTLWGTPLTSVGIIFGLIGVAGANWFLVGLFCTLFPGAVRNTFHPFADHFTRRMGFGLTVLGLLMTLGGLLAFR